MNQIRELEQGIRQFIAWMSIWDDRVSLNLDRFQTRQAETKKKNANEAVDLRISEAYQWFLVHRPQVPVPPASHLRARPIAAAPTRSPLSPATRLSLP